MARSVPADAGSALVAAAFDRAAPGYDASFGRNPVGLVFRHVVQHRLLRLFPPGARVLDLGCGTGSDALALAEAGRRVHGVDVSAGMIEQARGRAAGAMAERLSFEVRAVETLGELAGPFDGAYSDHGALNCADLGAVAAGLSRALRPGAPVVFSLMGRRPLPALLERALTGRGGARGRGAPRVAGIELPVGYPSVGELRAAFGDAFAWTGAFALGVVLPGPEHAAWASRHPQRFGLLAAIEGRVRHWPLLRSLGDHVVVEGRRR
jgi:SAM-dependent methyltransferase